MPNPAPQPAVILRRAVLLRRYENTLAADVASEVNTARDKLAALLQGQDVTAVSAGRVQRRLASVASQANAILSDAYSRINTLTRRELYDLGKVSRDATASDITRAARSVGVDLTHLGLPSPDQLRSIVTNDPVQGAVMRDWWSRQKATTANAFRTQVQLGLTRSETNAQIVQRVRGKALGGGRYAGGIMDISTRQAVTLTRTAVNHVYAGAAQLSYQENADILQGWEYCAIEDRRTCAQCADLDGTIYAVDDPRAPVIPLHFSCRCTSLPVLDYSALGVRTPKTPERQTYPQWFDDQKSSVQDAILGPAKAAMVRSGKASFADLVRDDGTTASLAEVRAAIR